MKAQRMRAENVAGRVVVGPKKLRNGYARIVSQKDGSGRIEKLDTATGTWRDADEGITFSEVWSAPAAPVSPWAGIERNPDR
jgi:hypothetical protein